MTGARPIIAWLALAASALADVGCGSTEPGCPTPHLASFDTTFLRATETCGPEDLTEEADLVTAGTTVTVEYDTLAMPCGGDVVVDLAAEAGRITLSHHVEGSQGECGCFNWFHVVAEIEVCEPGDYVIVVNDVDHAVTL